MFCYEVAVSCMTLICFIPQSFEGYPEPAMVGRWPHFHTSVSRRFILFSYIPFTVLMVILPGPLTMIVSLSIFHSLRKARSK